MIYIYIATLGYIEKNEVNALTLEDFFTMEDAYFNPYDEAKQVPLIWKNDDIDKIYFEVWYQEHFKKFHIDCTKYVAEKLKLSPNQMERFMNLDEIKTFINSITV